MNTKPNIVWILSDDTNNGMLGYTGGNMLTPTIDSIARNGMSFNQFHTVAPACGPSRYSYLTGHYPGRCPTDTFRGNEQYWLGFNAVVLPDKERTIGHAMREAGYTTGFVGKWHVDGSPEDLAAMVAFNPDDDPCDPEVEQNMARHQEHVCGIVRKAGFDYARSVIWGNHQTLPVKAENHNIEWITKAALDFVTTSAQENKPFFLSMAPTTIHAPDHASSMLVDPRLTAGGRCESQLGCQASRQSVYDRIHEAGLVYDSTTVGALWMDDAVSAIMDKLRTLGILDNTVVIFSTDHGPSMGGKFATYQRGVRIPFAIQWPGRFPAGTICNALAQNVDLVPTLLDLAGAKPPRGMHIDGKSLVPLLTGQQTELPDRDDLYFEFGYSRSVRTVKWKYIAWRPPDAVADEMEKSAFLRTHFNRVAEPGVIPNTLIMGTMLCYPHFFEPDQLYDLEHDPHETKNLASDDQYRPMLTEMQARLDARLATFAAPFPLAHVHPFLASAACRDRAAKLIKAVHEAKDVWIKNKKAEGYYSTEPSVVELLEPEMNQAHQHNE